MIWPTKLQKYMLHMLPATLDSLGPFAECCWFLKTDWDPMWWKSPWKTPPFWENIWSPKLGCSPFPFQWPAFSWLVNGGYQPLFKSDDPSSTQSINQSINQSIRILPLKSTHGSTGGRQCAGCLRQRHHVVAWIRVWVDDLGEGNVSQYKKFMSIRKSFNVGGNHFGTSM